jgi:hypothetical protein
VAAVATQRGLLGNGARDLIAPHSKALTRAPKKDATSCADWRDGLVFFGLENLLVLSSAQLLLWVAKAVVHDN